MTSYLAKTAFYIRWDSTNTIIVNLTNGVWSLSGNFPANYTNTVGTGSLMQALSPTGIYIVTFSPVSGYTTPDPKTNTVTAGSSVGCTGTYTRISGTIQIAFTPSSLTNAGWAFTNYPSDYTNSLSGTGPIALTNVPSGTYSVQFGAMAGYFTPAPQTKTFSISGTTNVFTGVYSNGPMLTVVIYDYVNPHDSITNYNLRGVGAGTYTVSGATGMFDGVNWYFSPDVDVTLTAYPTNLVIGTNAYNSFFYRWYEIIGNTRYSRSMVTNYTVTMSSHYDPVQGVYTYDRTMYLMFSREYFTYDNAPDLDGDGLPDAWEIAYSLNPESPSGNNGAGGNPDLDFIPSTSTNAPSLYSIDTNMVSSYLAAGGATPGYPLRGNMLYNPAVAQNLGYARTNNAFDNLLECRGMDGYYRTNGPSGAVANDDPYTDPSLKNTANDGVGDDGWKYYFWYWRSASAYAAGVSNSANLAWVQIYPSNDRGFGNGPDHDTDNDGIGDADEYAYGTDPTHADTDADSMDDYWEYAHSTVCKPLYYVDGVTNADNDYFALSTNTYILTNGMVGTAFTNSVYYIGSGPTAVNTAWVELYTNTGAGRFDLYQDRVLNIVGTLTNRAMGTLYTVTVYYGTATNLSGYKSGYPVWVDNDSSGAYSSGDTALVNPARKHDLLYMAPPSSAGPGVTSFDPRTSWSAGAADTNAHPNTAPYVNYQEYMGGDYLGRVSWSPGGNIPFLTGDNDGDIPSSRNAWTNPENKDTDGDLMPDGWELYVGLNPQFVGDANLDADDDGLVNQAEWANSSDTLGSTAATWPAKIWPTDPGALTASSPNDPHPKDTDWDGLEDGAERTPGPGTNLFANPTSYDSDGDMIPDGWELYAGTSVTTNDANLDLDGDGLLNWQEYWTGTVSEWMECDPNWGLYFLARRLMSWDAPGIAESIDVTTGQPLWGGAALMDERWFIPPDFLTCPSFLYYNGIITNLATLRDPGSNGFSAAASLAYDKYHMTLANVADSDMDGMDDFWEVFHCLNPIRGYQDLVYGPWGMDTYGSSLIVGSTDADPNTPGYQVGTQGAPFTNVMALVNYWKTLRALTDVDAQAAMVIALVGPHNFGLVGMDPDNDGLPNFEEYTYYRQSHLHTAPSPIWRTDPYLGGDYGFVARNYTRDNTSSDSGFNALGFSGISYSITRGSRPFRWAAMTEGFDTDNDMIGDYDEVTGYRQETNTIAGTDPLWDESPLKNRVLWLDGTNSWARSYAWSHYGDFSKFSVEAWVRPSRLSSAADQVVVEKTSRYTMQLPDGSFSVSALANFQLGISSNGLPYILFHDVSGYTTHRAVSSRVGQLQANQWAHLAGVFDGSNLTLYVNGEASATHHTTDVPARGIQGEYSVWHPNCNLSVGARELSPGWMFPGSGANFFAGCIDEARVWDRVLAVSEIKARKDRRLTPAEVGTVLAGNSPYTEGANNLFAYYRFTDLPDPSVEGTKPSGFPTNRPTLSYNYSSVYTNYLVIAADRVKRIPRMLPLDTRVIDGTPVASNSTPDPYGISATNYLGLQLPADFRNSANPYNFTHSTYNIDMGRGMWLCGRAQGLRTNTWLSTLTDDPDSTDADGDGLPDWWEQLYGLDLYDATGDNGAWGDPDHDGLNNRAEYLAGTNPKSSDTDNDGIGDYDSRRGPGTRTWGELYDDGDGMPDSWETQYGLDPHYYDAHVDQDDDGWSNYAEYQAGTDPSNSTNYPTPTVSGAASYYGTNTATLRILGYQTNTMDGVAAISMTGSVAAFTLTGLKEGDFYLFGCLDVNGSASWNSGEPCGVTYPQPVYLSWANLDDVNIGIRDQYPGYGRFSWTAPAGTNLVQVVINKISESGGPNALTRYIRSPRNYFHEWDYQLSGIYGLGAGTYQWWVSSQNGTFSVQWPSSVSQPTLVYPRGHILIYARHQIRWTMDSYSTAYHLQVADRNGVIFTNVYAPAPYPGADGVYQDYLPVYLSEWGNGAYFYRLAGYNPAGESEWSDAQSFEIDLSSTNSYWISGSLYYFGKARATNIIIEAFANAGFGGQADARMTMALPCTTNAFKTAFTLRGLRNKTYYVRAYTDISPAGGARNGKLDYWESWGFVKDPGNDYQPRAIAMTNTHMIEGTKVVIRDRDTDNDHLPDAWEMSYFGNLDQTGDMDYDGDGENNLTEYALDYLDTDPTLFDTDGDGLSDHYERLYGGSVDYNPYDPIANPVGTGLNPTRWDTDSDAYSDGAEIRRYHTDPLDPADYPRYMPLCYGPCASPADYDGDGRTDAVLFNPADGMWYLLTWQGQCYSGAFGSITTQPLLGDYDGDGCTDVALYDPPSGTWYIYTWQGRFGSLAFGDAEMIPVPADYDGDFRTDLGVYDTTTGTWYLYSLWSGQFTAFQFGNGNCIPVTADYDGDAKSDFAVYHLADNTWYIYTWRGQFTMFQFGRAGCIPVPGDYDGDGKSDFAVYEVSTGTWHLFTWTQQFVSGQFGWNGIIPVSGDYDGDGRRDVAVYYPAAGMWYVYTWTGHQYQGQFGFPSAMPPTRGR